MNLKNIIPGQDIPNDINVIIEVSMNSEPVKYEFNKETSAIHVDRFLHTSMLYPCNYGFVPKTLSGDGDPLDALVYTNFTLIPKTIIRVKPIGALVTEDESGKDEKLLTVPIEKLDPAFSKINNYTDMPEIILKKIEHFFEHYKDLESGKWVKVKAWKDREETCDLILDAIKNYSNK